MFKHPCHCAKSAIVRTCICTSKLDRSMSSADAILAIGNCRPHKGTVGRIPKSAYQSISTTPVLDKTTIGRGESDQ